MHISHTPALWQLAWQLLETAARSGDGGFALPVIATSGPKGNGPRGRIVVLRGAEREASTLSFYTDRRSLKIEQLAANPSIAWTFWDAERRLQCCAGGTARIVPDHTRDAIFADLPKHGRRAYATLQPPGTPLSGPASGLPADWDDRDADETRYARQHFAIVRTELLWADILQLDREGNTRLSAVREAADLPWSFTYVVP